MPRLRPYVDGDWEAVLDLCLLAFAPACRSLERLLGTDLDWKACITRHLRSLTRPSERRRLVVAERRGSVVGVVHYQVDRATHSGSMGVSAVHPAQQGKGIGLAMYRHVLAAMAAQGVKYATADTGADSTYAAARRAYESVGFVSVPTVHYFMAVGESGAGASRRTSRPSHHKTRRATGANALEAGRLSKIEPRTS
jgi:ribosomal protein S18 acetylase RimI-like enzyme